MNEEGKRKSRRLKKDEIIVKLSWGGIRKEERKKIEKEWVGRRKRRDEQGKGGFNEERKRKREVGRDK